MLSNNLKLVVSHNLEQVIVHVHLGYILVLDLLEALAPVEENLGDGEEEGWPLLDAHPAQTFEGSSWNFHPLLLLGEGDGSTKDHVWKTILGTMSSFSKLEIRAVMLSLESISVMFLSEKRIWKGSRSFSEVLMFPNCFVICEACLPVVVL